MDTVEQRTPADTATFDAFISYSHAADGLLAPRLQSGLQRFAKPWWRRRALRVFRDESSLSANPHLWSSITEALDESGWFVLLLSSDAARSPWVNQEIEYWIEHKDPSRILPVVTDGEFAWDGDVTGDSAPEALRGVFSEEPRWVDLRFARDEEQLDLKNPRFSAAVADIASAIRGVPKDELESEEVKQHRRTIRTAWAASVLVLLLGVAAVVAAIQSSVNAAEAEQQAEAAEENAALAARNEEQALAEAERADANAAEAEENAAEAERAAQLAKARELASASIANLDRNPELATLLALTALDRAPGTDDPPAELVNAIWQAGSSNRLVDVIETGYDGEISLSADGTHLAATTGLQTLAMFDAQTHEVLWEYNEETVDSFVYPVIGPDGRTSLGIYDSGAEWLGPVEETDDLPNRVVIFTPDGEVEATLEFPECNTVGNADWSSDGRFLAVSSGFDFCIRGGDQQWIEVFDTATWQSAAYLPIDGAFPNAPSPRFDSNGRLYALRGFESNVIFEAETFDLVEVSDASGIGDVSPDGSRMYGFYTTHGNSGRGGSATSVLSFDTETGALADILYTGIRYPHVPFGVTATEDGKYVIVAVGGATTHIYDPLTGEERFRLPTGSVETVGYDPERQLLYTSGSEEGSRVWDLGASSVGITSTGDLGEHPWVNGNGFVIGQTVGAIVQVNVGAESLEDRWLTGFFDLATGEIAGSVPGSLPHAALANDRFLLSTFGEDADAWAIYDPESGVVNPFLECENVDPVTGCLDPGDNIVVSVDGDEILAYPYAPDEVLAGVVHTIDPETGEILRTDPIPEDELVRDTYTDTWVLGSPTTRIDYRVVDRESGEVVWHDELGHARHEVSRDGRWLLTRGDAEVQLVDTETWEVRFTIDGFNDIRGTGFNGDGSLIAVADADSMRIIDIETGLFAQQVQLPGVSDIYFLADETVVVGTSNGIFGTVSLSTDELVSRTRDNLRRTFTEQECTTYQIEPCPTLQEMREG